MKRYLHCFLVFWIVLMAAPVGANTWTQLEIPEAKPVEKSAFVKMVESELPRNAEKLMAFPQILRMEIIGGTGTGRISETVFLFKNIPDFAMARAESDLKPNRDSIAFSSFKACTWDANAEVHTCKGAGIANTGAVDVLPVVSQRHVLLVSRARQSGRARTVLWLGYHSAASIYFLPYADMGFPKLGTDTINVTSYRIGADKGPELPPDPMEKPTPVRPPELQPDPHPPVSVESRLPGAEPDGKGLALPQPEKPAPLPQPETEADWRGYTVFSAPVQSRPIADVWKQDRLERLQKDPSLLGYHWVRVQVKGHDLNPAKSVRLALPAAPALTYVYAWSESPKEFHSFLGDLSECLKRGAKGCPLKVDGTRWYDLSTLITTNRIAAQSLARQAGNGQMILWMAFSVPVTKLGHTLSASGTRISAVSWEARGGERTVTPMNEPGVPSLEGLPEDGPMRLMLRPRKVNSHEMARYLNSMGIVPQDSGLLSYPYVLRIALKPGSDARHALEITLPFDPLIVLGRSVSATGATARNARIGMVQMGRPSTCRIKGDQMHCPMHFHGIGWRDLSGGFQKTKTRLIFSANSRSEVREMVYFLAFDKLPTQLQVEEYPTTNQPPVVTTSLYQIQFVR